MKRRSLLIVCCGLMAAGSMVAQSGGPVSDPISGTWTGYLGRNETNRTPMTVELKFDGRSAVSGTITGPQLTPGDIKAGTFDPSSGALTLEVVLRGDGIVAVLEGTAFQATATGRVRLDNQSGLFTMTKGPGNSAVAPQTGGFDMATGLRAGFGEVSGWITKAADLVPADKYTYQPVKTVRTFGQLVGHVVDGYSYYCGRAAGKNVQWSDATATGPTDKATLAAKLKQATDACNTVYAGANPAGPLFVNVGHANLHYGNVITYMRMLGLTPPSS